MNTDNNNAHRDSRSNRPLGLTPTNMIAVYTVLRILLRMRSRLGLEAMLEYINAYTDLIERTNPDLKEDVTYALNLIQVEKIYHDALKR